MRKLISLVLMTFCLFGCRINQTRNKVVDSCKLFTSFEEEQAFEITSTDAVSEIINDSIILIQSNENFAHNTKKDYLNEKIKSFIKSENYLDLEKEYVVEQHLERG